MKTASILALSFFLVLQAWGQSVHEKRNGHKTAATGQSASVFPRLTSSLGNVLSNTLPRSFMQQLVDSSLVVRDQHNAAYIVTGFEFGYRHTEQTVDSTGRASAFRNYISWNFQGSRPDSLWRARIKGELTGGDQLFYDHIIAEGKDGRKFKAPALSFTVK